LAAGELAETLARWLVRAERRLIGGVPGDLFGDRPDLLHDTFLVGRVAE
jgi:hypothetical protein